MELIHGIQDAVNPVGYSIYKNEERMTEALGMVLDLKERLPLVAAKDPHYLVAAHDARNMALSAESLPHGAHAQGVARLVHSRGLPGAQRRRLAQVGLR